MSSADDPALWLTPRAIRRCFQREGGFYLRWVQQASDDQLRALARRVLADELVAGALIAALRCHIDLMGNDQGRADEAA